jgi:hypothetical protein
MMKNITAFSKLKEVVEENVEDLKDDLKMVYKYAKVYNE